MAKYESFKKKELNKDDYAGKERAAKAVKGSAIALAAAAFLPKAIKAVINITKKVITKQRS